MRSETNTIFRITRQFERNKGFSSLRNSSAVVSFSSIIVSFFTMKWIAEKILSGKKREREKEKVCDKAVASRVPEIFSTLNASRVHSKS